MTPAVPVEKFMAGVIDTGGKFTSVINAGGAPWLANISANFQNSWNDPYVIFRGLGEDALCKKPEAKNLLTLSQDFYFCRGLIFLYVRSWK